MSESGDGKRRLSVIQEGESEEGRSPQQWTLIGAGAILLFCVPLAMLAAALTKSVTVAYLPEGTGRTIQEAWLALAPGVRLKLSLVMLLAPISSLALAAVAGGALVGRFGGRAGTTEATMAGLFAGVGVVIFTVVRSLAMADATSLGGVAAMQQLMSAVIVLLVTTLLGRLGGWLGFRRRSAATQPASVSGSGDGERSSEDG